MKKLFGSYGIFETLFSFIFFGLFLYLNYLYFGANIYAEQIPDEVIFMVIFWDFILLVIIAAPIILKQMEKISNDKIKDFLDLPKENQKFTFSVISSFLGEQALASFLATVLIVTGREALLSYGPTLSAIYTFTLFIFAIFLASTSLIRFIMLFEHQHKFKYAILIIVSTAVTHAFFQVGLKLAA